MTINIEFETANNTSKWSDLNVQAGEARFHWCSQEWGYFTSNEVSNDILPIRTLGDLCKFFNVESPLELNYRLFKTTDCGASIVLYLSDGRVVRPGSPLWTTLTGETSITGFVIQAFTEDDVVETPLMGLPCEVETVQKYINELEEAFTFLPN